MNISAKTQNIDIFVSVWLFILTIMTFLIIVIGGLTRLTESGLSMVNWRPIMGFLPPLNYEDWLKVFNDYKNSPEFLIVNKTMNLQEFKYIFWSKYIMSAVPKEFCKVMKDFLADMMHTFPEYNSKIDVKFRSTNNYQGQKLAAVFFPKPPNCRTL